MEGKKISIIVPVYNSEKYVADTIKSLMDQTLKEIEIILVNDGSTDNSLSICEKYAKEDDRIIVIDQPNGGNSSARNAGMKVATGKYIMFSDADDLYDIDSCKNMYEAIEKSKADYVIGNYQMMSENGTKWEKPAFDIEKYKEFKLTKDDFEKSFFVMNSTVWNKIYRVQFLRENDITFKVPTPCEDDYFTSLCYIKANYGYYIPKVMYFYRDSSNSISKNCSLGYFKGINYTYKKIYESFLNNNEMNYYRYVYAKKNAYLLCKLIDTDLLDEDEKIGCLKDFEWYFDLMPKLKIDKPHETLRNLVDLVSKKDYENAIIEMNRLRIYRKDIPDSIKRRMSFPTRENYKEMAKYDKEFQKERKSDV